MTVRGKTGINLAFEPAFVRFGYPPPPPDPKFGPFEAVGPLPSLVPPPPPPYATKSPNEEFSPAFPGNQEVLYPPFPTPMPISFPGATLRSETETNSPPPPPPPIPPPPAPPPPINNSCTLETLAGTFQTFVPV